MGDWLNYMLLWKRVGVGVVSLAWSQVFFQELVLG